MSKTLVPIRQDVIFQFLSEVSKQGNFKEKTSWGFEVTRGRQHFEEEGHRIGKVVAVGPECKQVKTGMEVVIQKLMWTNQFGVEGKQYWKTDESKVLAVIEK